VRSRSRRDNAEVFGITDTWSFVRVAYIHNAGYLGGAIGLIVALATIRPHRHDQTDTAGTELSRPED
jgi:hypothetical protein